MYVIEKQQTTLHYTWTSAAVSRIHGNQSEAAADITAADTLCIEVACMWREKAPSLF